jgi:hypothetical protein
MVVKINMKIIPDKIIFNRKIYEIKNVDKSLQIDGFEIYLDKEKNVEKIVLNGQHPNANPKTKILCLSEEIIGKQFEEKLVPTIYSFISLYNLDHCFFRPLEKFEVVKNFTGGI